MSVLQSEDGWWGEGDDMFFIDGEKSPSITGTGSEDYFLGAFDFGDKAFSYAQFGAPLKGEERAGGRCGPRSNTDMRTGVRIIIFPWRIGIRPSHTPHFRPSRRCRIVCHGYTRWEARATPANNNRVLQ